MGGPCDGTVMKVAIGGGVATMLASAQENPIAIAVDATSVYWTNEGTLVRGGATRAYPSPGPTPAR